MKNAVLANCEEYASLVGSGQRELSSVHSIGDVRLTVISAGKNIFEGAPGIPEREAGAIWKQLQSESLHLSSRSNQVTAEESGHYVQFDQPQVVIQQVLDLVGKTKRVP